MPVNIMGTTHKIVEIQTRISCLNCGREQLVRNSEHINPCPCMWKDPKLNRQDGRISILDIKDHLKEKWPGNPDHNDLQWCWINDRLDELQLRLGAKESRP